MASPEESQKLPPGMQATPHPSTGSAQPTLCRQIRRDPPGLLVDDALVQPAGFSRFSHGAWRRAGLFRHGHPNSPTFFGDCGGYRRDRYPSACGGPPAQRGKDMLFVFTICFLSLFLLFFRLLQPELLVNLEKFADFAAYLAALQTPSSPFLPSTWAAAAFPPFVGLTDGDPLFHYCLLLTTALFLVLVGSWLSTTLYHIGWSKAQEFAQMVGSHPPPSGPFLSVSFPDHHSQRLKNILSRYQPVVAIIRPARSDRGLGL